MDYNNPKMKNELSDEEFAIQMVKIVLGIILGIFLLFGLWHVNDHLKNIENQLIQLNEAK